MARGRSTVNVRSPDAARPAYHADPPEEGPGPSPETDTGAYGVYENYSARQDAASGSFDGPYGQNTQQAERDQEQYTQHREHDLAEQHGLAAGAPYGEGERDEAVVASGAVVALHGDDSVPPEIREGLHKSTCTLLHFSAISFVAIGICAFIAVSSVFSLIFEVDPVNVVFLALSGLVGLAVAGTSRQVRLVFNHDSHTVSVQERRCLTLACPSTVIRGNYRDLHGAGFTGSPGIPGELYFNIGDRRVVVFQRLFQTHGQIAAELGPWNAYLLARQRDGEARPGDGLSASGTL